VLPLLCQVMSKKRQVALFDRLGNKRCQITTLTRGYSDGEVCPLHFHDRDQVVYASKGVMTVRTKVGTWVVPPNRAVWIPAKVPHTITMSGTVAMRTLYLNPRLAGSLPRTCCVVNVSPLLKELIVHACSFHKLKKSIQWQSHLIDVILDQLERIEMVPMQLPHLSDPRAVRAAEALMADPGNRRALAQICKSSAVSKRTLERLFQEDVGMSFGRWRQQLRLMHAMRLLAEGAKVTHAALEAGYSTPSAFISMFRRTLGTTPTLYFKSWGRGSARRG
jgi:AraC-like DNA-binding protein/quercetin dioxygenase-like cupin family protein